MRGVFVVGTDTDIGKTLVSAWLVRHWRAEYWKPVQTGSDQDSDSARVADLAPGAVIHPPAYLFKAPLSPHAAAALENARIDADALILPAAQGPLVVEGAGGVLVPLNESVLSVDFVARTGLPALIVARSGLGTINHTLLTIEALRGRHVPILGVVMNGPRNPGNAQAIRDYGQVAVLAEIEPLDVAAQWESLPGPAFPCPEVRT